MKGNTMKKKLLVLLVAIGALISSGCYDDHPTCSPPRDDALSVPVSDAKLPRTTDTWSDRNVA